MPGDRVQLVCTRHSGGEARPRAAAKVGGPVKIAPGAGSVLILTFVVLIIGLSVGFCIGRFG